MKDTVLMIRDRALDNQYSALFPEADYLETRLEVGQGHPLKLYETCRHVARHVVQLQADGSLPERDNFVQDVFENMQNTADDIESFDSYVSETVKARAKRRFERLSDAQKAKIAIVTEAVADQSEPELADELREDAATVVANEDLTEDAAESRYRLGSKLVRVIAIGGAGLTVLITALSQLEPAVGGARFLWEIVRPLIGS